ncbi:MAG: peptidylprolyl isomerase [Flavitalea sp.]
MFFKCTLSGLLLLSAFSIQTASAQTLFSYGGNKVSKQEFLKAYHKNNNDSASAILSYSDYLELYLRFKLKVKAAMDERMDTLQNQLSEVQAFRNQLADTYLKEDASMQLLVDEAFERNQKDIHLYDIFIRLPQSATPQETAAAETSINAAFEALHKGAAFETVAHMYNPQEEGPNNGDLGFVSVFTLPYELETLAYSLQPGKFSNPFRARSGYHILLNREERRSAGKLRIAQVLLAFKPGFTEQDKERTALRADSIYKALQEGAVFSKMAAAFSDDNLTYNIGGEMPAFEPGRYEPGFENAAFGLGNDSDISKPVRTAFGYHILKRIQRIPVSEDRNSKEWREVLKERVQQSDRMEVGRKMLIKKIQSLLNFKKNTIDEKQLSITVDSILQRQSIPGFAGLSAGSELFSLGKESVTLNDFHHYLDGIRSMDEQVKGKTNRQLFDQFTETATIDYYRNHLEEYNKDFAAQLNEFREGNLLFEIMQRKVWDAAAIDSLGLEKYYAGHKDKYEWELSADALILTCPDKKTAEKVQELIKDNYRTWKKISEKLNNNAIQADSARYELSQIPVAERTNFTEGLITAEVVNEQDHSVTFAYIIKLYKEKELKNFEDARGAVINDYQNFLEEKWISGLKGKYPVRVKKKVFRKLAKK